MKYNIKRLYIFMIISVLTIIIVIPGCSEAQSESEGENLEWQEDEHFLQLIHNGEILWQLNYSEEEDKPYFYPLRTFNGHDLALERPDDHPWHRGLWFSWKYINGVNYWEEDPDLGLSDGRTYVREVKTNLMEDYSATIEILLEYAPEEGSIALEENRTLHVSSPNENGDYTIDWSLHFTAVEDVLLDRTIPAVHGGVEWGGYAGLGYRADDNELTSFTFTESNGWTNSKSLTDFREAATWMGITAEVIDSPGQHVGLTIFDHPSNPRYPTPWYIWYSEGNNAFFMPAFLYNEGFSLDKGESFSLQYRVFIYEGDLGFNQLDQLYKQFSQ